MVNGECGHYGTRVIQPVEKEYRREHGGATVLFHLTVDRTVLDLLMKCSPVMQKIVQVL